MADLPGVGANLADHPWVSIDLPCAAPDGDPAIFQLVATARSSRADPAGAPDLQLMVCGPYPLGDGYAFSLAAALLTPASRGRLRLRSRDAGGGARDRPRLLPGRRRPGPARRVPAARRRARRTAGPCPTVTRGARIGPPRDVLADDGAAAAWIRASAMTYHHPVGTCAMGLDPRRRRGRGSGRPRVRGGRAVGGGRVGHARHPPSANTNIPTIMLAEHLAARRWTGAAGARVPESAAAG